MKHPLLFVVLFFCFPSLCLAQRDSIIPFDEAYKRVYNVTKVSGIKPVMDGRLDEDFWTKQGEWSDRFIQSGRRKQK